MTTRLLTPTLALLPGYQDALERGWSPNTMRPEAAGEALEAIAKDAALYVERQTDLKALGGSVTLPDGSQVRRIPGRNFWIWDDTDFCGAINLRWQPGTAALPPHVLGHTGYTIVPWKRRLGHASAALRAVLPHAREVGLPYLEVTTAVDNLISQRVIVGAGGVLVERFIEPPAFGAHECLRYRIAVAPSAP
jgi:predicted acetyltransferase